MASSRSWDFNLKSKEEIKTIIEKTDDFQNKLIHNLPTFKKLIDLLEQYGQAENLLSDLLDKIITTLDEMSDTGMNDFNQGMNSVMEIISDLNTGKINSNSEGTVKLVASLKGEYSGKKEQLTELQKKNLSERKKFDSELEKLQNKMVKGASMDEINTFKDKEKEKQSALMGQLQVSVVTNRQFYGKIIEGFIGFFKTNDQVAKESTARFESNVKIFDRLYKNKSNVPREIRSLMTNKKQVYVNLAGISQELKDLLKASHYHPKDLADKTLVTELYKQMCKLVNEGRIPEELLDQLASTGNVDKGVIEAQKRHKASPARSAGGWKTALTPAQRKRMQQQQRNNPQPAQQASVPTPPPAQSYQAPPPPPVSYDTGYEEETYSSYQAPPPPPPPSSHGHHGVPPPPPPPSSHGHHGVPPPPPPMGNVPPPPQLGTVPPPPPMGNVPPPPRVSARPAASTASRAAPSAPAAGGPTLLEQIRAGKTLTKVQPPKKEELTVEQKDDLASLLSSVMANRRKDIADDDDEEEEDSEEWDD